MKILTLCYEFPPLGGGGSKVVAGLTRQLADLGHTVDVVTMGYGGLPRREAADGVTVYRVPCLRLSSSVCSPPELASYLCTAIPFALQLVRRNHYDINHTHFIFPDGVTAWILKARTGLPYVLTAHGSDVPSFNPDRFKLMHKILAPAWHRIVAGADRIISPSQHLSHLIRQKQDQISVDLIPNGIDPAKYRADRARAKRILLVSRLFERKGVQHFLRAVDGLQLDHEVEIVGAGPYLSTLRSLAARQGEAIRFRGWLDGASRDLRELYETSDIFVFPSEMENFPIVLLEAMAAGAAIITTQGTGCEEVVGDAALLVKPGDPVGLRAALVRLMREPDLCRRLGWAARTRLEERFGWPAVARQYLQVYRGAMESMLPATGSVLAGGSVG
jgi:glycosyltransferase involved in cell wall biosynthesis